MKTYLTYGFYMALGNALIVFALYFLGWHSEAAKLDLAQKIQMFGSIGICIACLIYGTREHRDALPPMDAYGYGRALGTGFMIALFASLFGAIFTYLYAAVVNPGFIEVMLQAQSDQLEAKGLSADKIEQVNSMTRSMMKPAIQAGIGFFMGLFFSTLFALITAAFLKRSARDEVVAS
jgi:hypothetical protein